MPLRDYDGPAAPAGEDQTIPIQPPEPASWWARALATIGTGAGKAWDVASSGLDYLNRPFDAVTSGLEAYQAGEDPLQAAQEGLAGERQGDWREILQPQTDTWWSLPSMAGELWAPFQWVGNWMLDPWYDTGTDYETARGQAKDAAVQGLGMGFNILADPLNIIPVAGAGSKAWQAIGQGIDELASISPRFRSVLHAVSPRYRGAAEDLNEIMRLGRADVQRLERTALDELAEVRRAYDGLDPRIKAWIDQQGIGSNVFENPREFAATLKKAPAEILGEDGARVTRELGVRLEASAGTVEQLRAVTMQLPFRETNEIYTYIAGTLTEDGRQALRKIGLDPERPSTWGRQRPDLAREMEEALQGKTLAEAPEAVRSLSIFQDVATPTVSDPYIASALLSVNEARRTVEVDLARDIVGRFGWSTDLGVRSRLAEGALVGDVTPRGSSAVTSTGRRVTTGVPWNDQYLPRNETLSQVAERFGTTVDDILEANPELRRLAPNDVLPVTPLNPPKSFRVLSQEAQDFLLRAVADDPYLDSRHAREMIAGTRYHPEVASEIEQAIKNWQAAGPETVLHALDKYMGAWKGWTTAPVPSYHARNMLSNVWQNMLVGVRDPRVYDEAYRVMRGEAMVRVAGRELSSDDIMRMAREQGILDTGFAAADIRRTVSQAAGEASGLYETVQRVPEALLRLAANYENHARLANFIDGLKHGLSPAEAALRTKKALFDYGDLTAFERNVLKRVTGFYTFTARNLPLQLEVLVTQPGVFSALNRVPEQLSDQPPIGLSDWQEDTPGIIRGGRYYGLGGVIPSADLYGWFASPQEELVNWIGPWTTPIQLLANYDTFTRRPIADPPASLGDPTGFPTSQVGVPIPLWMDYLLANMAPGGRELNILRNVVEPSSPIEQGDPIGARIFNRAVTPVPGYPLRPEAIGWGIQDQQERIRYILEQAGMARTDAEREYWLQLLDQALQEGI